ncbi:MULTISPECIES: LytR/AlgR family response regulator transcription factor [Flavobacteriaceae]|uniref:LytR/AlgR family response regulator transcription factor n=1 Tax=Flavobacteriaceae TaxID=49546 RepID=UPI0014914BC4|nr:MULTISPECIES: LytTR family DNA-binding domain-containing protein [Allomuricauda]MDC6366773.1 LytTR family DNA-binding domain-containing protein [Muricauda sp. AC10]
MKIKTIIVDDEPLAIKVLEDYVKKLDQLDLLETFSNAVDANNYVQENKVDLIFLDINMPVLDGFDFLKCLNYDPCVVITSAHEEYALKGYEVKALDYLVKPIPFPRFLNTVSRVSEVMSKKNTTTSSNEKPNFFIKIDNKKLQKVYLDDILVVESLKDYIRIKTTSDKYIIHKTLSSFTEELPNDKFIRIHRSFTVALDKIESMEGNSVEIDGIRYTIGRSYLNEVREIILNKSLN